MVRVIVDRHIKEGKELELANLLIELRIRAMRWPGYITGETLRELDDPYHWVTISTWDDAGAWTSWVASPQRRELAAKIDPLLTTPPKMTIFSPVS